MIGGAEEAVILRILIINFCFLMEIIMAVFTHFSAWSYNFYIFKEELPWKQSMSERE